MKVNSLFGVDSAESHNFFIPTFPVITIFSAKVGVFLNAIKDLSFRFVALPRNALTQAPPHDNTILDFRFWILDWELLSVREFCQSICRILFSNWYNLKLAGFDCAQPSFSQVIEALNGVEMRLLINCTNLLIEQISNQKKLGWTLPTLTS